MGRKVTPPSHYDAALPNPCGRVAEASPGHIFNALATERHVVASTRSQAHVALRVKDFDLGRQQPIVRTRERQGRTAAPAASCPAPRANGPGNGYSPPPALRRRHHQRAPAPPPAPNHPPVCSLKRHDRRRHPQAREPARPTPSCRARHDQHSFAPHLLPPP